MGSNDSKEVIFDIRTKKEYERAHLKDAILVPTPLPPLNRQQIKNLINKLRVLTKDLDKDTLIKVYCKKGIRSGLAEDILKEFGFRNIENLGGVFEYV